MQAPAWKLDTPRAILLATDLSSRCDRARDRAVFLARQWNARLVALTVIEFPADVRINSPSAQLETATCDTLLVPEPQARTGLHRV